MPYVKTAADIVLNRRGARRTYARALFFDLAGRFTPTLQTTYAGVPFRVLTGDRFVSRDIFVQGTYEDYWQLKTATALLERDGLRHPGRDVFVDIGAHIGTASFAAVLKCPSWSRWLAWNTFSSVRHGRRRPRRPDRACPRVE